MAFRMDKLTVKSQEAIQAAQSLASEKGHSEIDPLHLLAALLQDGEGIARPVLEKIGVNVSQVAKLVSAELDRKPQISGGSQPQPSRPLMNVLEESAKQSAAMKDEFVSVEHLLLALTTTDSSAKNLLQVN